MIPISKNRYHCISAGPTNLFAYYVGPNPSVSFNENSVMPSIDPTAFVGPFSSVIGDVKIEGNVFIAPNVSIRADEGFPFFIGRNANLQDGVIVHGLKDGYVFVGSRAYSVFIGNNVSCTHGCIVHGPCLLEDQVFVGFGAIVFDAVVGKGCYISTNALVTGGVRLAPERFVPHGAIIDTQQKADTLEPVSWDRKEFALEVQHVNQEFPAAYIAQAGKTRCSCGLAYDPHKVLRG